MNTKKYILITVTPFLYIFEKGWGGWKDSFWYADDVAEKGRRDER